MKTLNRWWKIISNVVLVLLCVTIYGHPAVAEPYEEEVFSDEYWSIQFENDFFASSGDRYYTHGTQISRLLMEEPPEWLKHIAEIFPAYETDGVISGVNYTVGQKIFTPNDTDSTVIVENDRPYAGYLYASAALLSRVDQNDISDVGNLLEFTVGMVGPAAMGKEVQTSFHDLIGIDSPQGWDNQLENELGLGFSYSRFWRAIHPVSDSLNFGVSPQLTAAVGNIYSYAASGIMFRLGTCLNNDLSPPNIRPGFPGIPLFSISNQYSWYLFGGIEARVVGRNIFLDGNTFQESYSVEKESFVADFQFGAVFRFKSLRLSISQMHRTREYTSQEDEMRYGAVNISFAI